MTSIDGCDRYAVGGGDWAGEHGCTDTHTFIALVEIAHFLAFFDDCTYEFVAADEARLAFQVAAVVVEVGPLR